MAEGLLKSLYPERYEVYSAGIFPSPVNNHAIKVMSEIGIDISKNRPKNIDEFSGRNFDYVLTVCDIASEICPYFPSAGVQIKKSFDDPSKFTGSEEEILSKFRRLRDDIKAWIIETFGRNSSL
jgi:arsenate reductase